MPTTRAAAVADELRRLIRSGELKGGTHLGQVEVATRFGVSTTPVREAFTSLEREGLLRRDVHRGAVVFAASASDLRENYELRMALEPLAAEIAAKNFTEEGLAELEELLGEMRVALRDDIDRHSQVLNPRFHMTIYAAADRPRLLEMITDLRDAAASYISLLAPEGLSSRYVSTVQEEHEEIVASLRARAPKRAAKATRTHLQHNYDEISAAISKLEDGQAKQ